MDGLSHAFRYKTQGNTHQNTQSIGMPLKTAEMYRRAETAPHDCSLTNIILFLSKTPQSLKMHMTKTHEQRV